MERTNNIVIIFPSFFTNRIAALARYVIELVMRGSHYRFKLITTDPGFTSSLDYGFQKIVYLKVRKRSFFREAAKHCHPLDLILFFGGYSGSVFFLNYFRRLPNRKVLNIFSTRFGFRDLSTLKTSDYFYMFSRIIRHEYFYSIFFPFSLFRKFYRQNPGLKIVVPSERLKSYYERLLPDTNCVCIYPGGDPSVFGKSNSLPPEIKKKIEDKVVVLHSGLGSLLRGVDNLIIAFSQLPTPLKRRSILLLSIYEKKTERTSVKLIRSYLEKYLSSEEYIIIDSALPNVYPIYDIAEICVFPYRYTGDIPEVPLTLIELIHRRKIVITSRLGCLSEWVNDGDLVNPKDIRELKNRIQRCIESLGSDDQVRQRNRITTWDDYWDKYQALLNQMVCGGSN